MSITEFNLPNIPSAEEQFRDLENSVRWEHLNDPLFRAQVHVGANIISHMFPDVEWPDAQRCALLVLAASRRTPL